MSRPTRTNLFLSTMAIALLAGGVIVFQHSPWSDASAADKKQAAAPAEQPAMPVPIITIAEKPVQLWKDFSSRLTAVDYVEIRPQVSGIIEKISFQDGQIVKKGDVLFTIDQRPYEAAVAQAQAELASAKDDSDYAQKELTRAESLLKTGAVSKQGYDERVNSQRTNKSAIAAAAAKLKAAQVDLDHTTIEAPVTGRISRPEITEGNLVTLTAAPLLTTIVSDKEIYADFEVDEQTYLTFVRAKSGQDVASEMSIPVRLSLTDDNKNYDGTIKSFDNKINPSTGTIRVRAIFANEDNALLPGMFAKVQIGSKGEENLITVPEKAVLTDQSRKFVYVIDNGAATYREVHLGDTVKNERIVLDGLKTGDQVIVENLMKIRPGAKVQGMTEEQIAQMQAQMAQKADGAPAGGGDVKKADAPKADDKKPDDVKADVAATPPADAAAAGGDAKAIPFDEPVDDKKTDDKTAPSPTSDKNPAQE